MRYHVRYSHYLGPVTHRTFTNRTDAEQFKSELGPEFSSFIVEEREPADYPEPTAADLANVDTDRIMADLDSEDPDYAASLRSQDETWAETATDATDATDADLDTPALYNVTLAASGHDYHDGRIVATGLEHDHARIVAQAAITTNAWMYDAYAAIRPHTAHLWLLTASGDRAHDLPSETYYAATPTSQVIQTMTDLDAAEQARADYLELTRDEQPWRETVDPDDYPQSDRTGEPEEQLDAEIKAALQFERRETAEAEDYANTETPEETAARHAEDERLAAEQLPTLYRTELDRDVRKIIDELTSHVLTARTNATTANYDNHNPANARNHRIDRLDFLINQLRNVRSQTHTAATAQAELSRLIDMAYVAGCIGYMNMTQYNSLMWRALTAETNRQIDVH